MYVQTQFESVLNAGHDIRDRATLNSLYHKLKERSTDLVGLTILSKSNRKNY